MMMRKFVFATALISLLLSGCSLDDDDPNFYFTSLTINSAELPESFKLNETYKINVTYTIPDECTHYEGLDVTKEDTTIRNVVAIGYSMTDDEACTEVNAEEEASFDFIVKYDQPYTFRFYKGDNSEGEPEFFEVVVPVE
ncbi:hypothetical protein [Maribacter thermophilus]|uniref:hypothetical protein n=1 Tax=Maribacter thermophilus TaxID=1197874 RepID=UPI0006415BBD|nr:hypothetical protein [Maribacter thermophilus]